MRSPLDNILKLTCGHLCVFLGWSYRYTYVGTPLNFTWGHLWVLYSLEILSVLTVYTVYLADTLEFTRGHPIQRTTFSEGKKHTEELFGIFPSCSPPQQGKEEWPGPFVFYTVLPFFFLSSSNLLSSNLFEPAYLLLGRFPSPLSISIRVMFRPVEDIKS